MQKTCRLTIFLGEVTELGRPRLICCWCKWLNRVHPVENILNPNISEENGKTLLHLAAERGKTTTVELLQNRDKKIKLAQAKLKLHCVGVKIDLKALALFEIACQLT